MSQFKAMLEAHPEWIAPRSDQHVVIGVPNSREHRKTFVEPGGSFSPGVGTFGVSVWIFDHAEGCLFTPEEMASQDLHWEWEEGYLPILNSEWRVGGIVCKQQLFATELHTLENIANSLQVTVKSEASEQVDLSLCVVVRPYGPAGGKLYTLSQIDEKSVAVNGKTVLLAQESEAQFGATSYTQEQQEISTFLKKGEVPLQKTVHDHIGLCSGALVYRLQLAPGSERSFEFDFFVHPLEAEYREVFQQYHRQEYQQKLAMVHAYWEQQLKTVRLQLPDKRVQNAYYAMLAQMLIATVQHEVRIANITYPFFWLRDGVYLINALDKAGLHDEVRLQLERFKERMFVGGFGAEPDAFGEGIWAFMTHYQLTHDVEWLRQVYPYIRERAEWIIRARTTQTYLYADVEARVPANRHVADTDLICEPAKDGLIQGRMDWHRPLIWINAFAHYGLCSVVTMAEALGLEEDVERYQQEAQALQHALHTYSVEHFGENERDTVCAIWPTQAFSANDPAIRQRFEHWWQEVRLQGKGEYKAEALWKYFELGQAHNYLLLQERVKVWQTVNYYLDHHDVAGLFGWLEDDHDIAEHWQQIEGWYKLPARVPHGWVSSEFFLLLRDMLVYEEQERLVIGQGIPAAWLQQGAEDTEVLGLPTAFGPVDVRIKPGMDQVEIDVVFHERGRLPIELTCALPWKEPVIHSVSGKVEKRRVVLSKAEYQQEGRVSICVECTMEKE